MIDIKEHNTIDGLDYRNLVINAAKQLQLREGEINELNVFPVPDGDTGSNMSMTIGNAAKALSESNENNLDAVAEQTAKAMLRGARGNSGVILSLLFRGIARALKNSKSCDGITLAEALDEGVKSAYNAIECPAEGTILTVARKCAETARSSAQINNSFEYVLENAISSAEKALSETIEQNPVLKKAGVVDAGGMGWLLVLRAMEEALASDQSLSYTPAIKQEIKERADFSAFEADDITFTFCTEFIITKKDSDSNTTPLKEYLATMGDSLVMLDDGEIVKVHVHTNEPHAVLGEALKWGEYETVKVENMRTQHTSKIAELEENPGEPLKDYGIVAVASGDGIEEIFYQLGVDKIVSGGQTMNPSTEDIYNAVKEIRAKTIFILPNNKNIILSAEQVKELAEENVVVIPTKTIPQGICSMLAFNCDLDEKENEQSMREALGTVTTMQITYAARDSEFDGLSIKEGDYLGMLEGRLLSSDKKIDKIFDSFINKILELNKETISIYYGEAVTEREAEEKQKYLQSRLPNAQIELYCGNQPVYDYIISAE
ncbi:MAG: DAK2 domain-containing protein [Clostridia bacterium]|nr:DAK2 domain-containing protein [Clostridia bacterium]